MHGIRLRLALLFLVAAAGVAATAGCDGDDNVPHAGAGVATSSASPFAGALSSGDLCRYVTAGDAGEALGGPAKEVPRPDPINTAGTIFETCAYSNAAETAAVLFRKSSAAAAAYSAALDATPAAEQLQGIGEEAFYNPGLGQLAVKQKDVYFIVTVGALATYPAVAPDRLKLLAARIAGRI